jgi:hypothetical protein
VRGVRNQVISPKIALKGEFVRPVIRRAIKVPNVPPPGRFPHPLFLPSPKFEVWSDGSTVNCAIQGDFINGLVRV